MSRGGRPHPLAVSRDRAGVRGVCASPGHVNTWGLPADTAPTTVSPAGTATTRSQGKKRP